MLRKDLPVIEERNGSKEREGGENILRGLWVCFVFRF